MKLAKIISIGAMSLICINGNAQQILGVGTSTCAAFTKAVNTPASLWYESWAVGFLSSMNYFGSKDFLKGKDPDAIMAAIKLSCEGHPLNQFGAAVLDVSTQLKNLTPEPPPQIPFNKKR